MTNTVILIKICRAVVVFFFFVLMEIFVGHGRRHFEIEPNVAWKTKDN